MPTTFASADVAAAALPTLSLPLSTWWCSIVGGSGSGSGVVVVVVIVVVVVVIVVAVLVAAWKARRQVST